MLFWCFFFPPSSFFFFSLFLFYSLFFLFPFCSLDAAKRKAWKLNRVGSLRNIYSSSSTNTEGNKTTRFRWTPPLYPFFNPLFWKLSSFRLSLTKCRNGNQICPKHACFHLMFAESFQWSFHLFVCAFYFTIHVPFSLLKFWPFPLVVEWWCLNYFKNPFSSFIYLFFYIPFIHVGTQCNISQVITVFKSVSIRCNDL